MNPGFFRVVPQRKRADTSQAECRGFESHHPLQMLKKPGEAKIARRSAFKGLLQPFPTQRLNLRSGWLLPRAGLGWAVRAVTCAN